MFASVSIVISSCSILFAVICAVFARFLRLLEFSIWGKGEGGRDDNDDDDDDDDDGFVGLGGFRGTIAIVGSNHCIFICNVRIGRLYDHDN